jgi:hypothetical protein
MEERVMNTVMTIERTGERGVSSPLERTVKGILIAMVPIWVAFQALEIGALFPPIGVLYAVGSMVVLAAIFASRKPWAPAMAAVWGAMMLTPESIPASGHLLHWDDLSTHFGHYLVIMTFFPLALALVATGIAAAVQNTRTPPAARPAPRWLRGLAIGTVTLIVAGNAATVILYALDVP